MANPFEGFSKVEEKNPTYEPCVQKVDGETIPKKVTEDKWMMGYYLGMREITTQGDKVSKIHDFVYKDCGDKSDLSDGVVAGDKISMWGRTTLDDLLNKNVPIGTCCVVKWLGKRENKTKTARFHVFEVLVNPSDVLTDGITASVSAPKSAPAHVEAQASQPVSNQADLLDDEDDDSPF